MSYRPSQCLAWSLTGQCLSDKIHNLVSANSWDSFHISLYYYNCGPRHNGDPIMNMRLQIDRNLGMEYGYKGSPTKSALVAHCSVAGDYLGAFIGTPCMCTNRNIIKSV